jgi:hypothetical protein
MRGGERSRPNLRYICLEGVTKSMKRVGEDGWSPGPDLNTGPSEYIADAPLFTLITIRDS